MTYVTKDNVDTEAIRSRLLGPIVSHLDDFEVLFMAQEIDRLRAEKAEVIAKKQRLSERHGEVCRERDRYRDALARIADAEWPGHGHLRMKAIAKDAL